MIDMPEQEQIRFLLTESVMERFTVITLFIESTYQPLIAWNNAGKYGKWELKYKKASKTLCTLYLKETELVALIILGKDERERVEKVMDRFSVNLREQYARTEPFHDGLWLFIPVKDDVLANDVIELIKVKRSPQKNLR